MAKDESKKEKRAKRKSNAGDESAMAVDAPSPIKKEKKEKKSKAEDAEGDDEVEELPVDAISPIARKLKRSIYMYTI